MSNSLGKYSGPTLTIGALGSSQYSKYGSQSISLGTVSNSINIFGDVVSDSLNVKKYEVIETTEDLLALSCAWYRIRQNNHTLQPTITSLLSDELFRHVSLEDREMADKVRDYYTKKFMVMTLKDQKFTMFRKDLKDYLVGDSKRFIEKMIPMVYRLPEFYVHDVVFDEIKLDFEKTIPNFNSLTRKTTKRNISLTPIKSFKRNSKSRGKFVEYWLKDSKNHAYRFGLKQDNPLLGFWDIAFNSGEMIISLNAQAGRRDELEYFNIGSILEG